MKHRIVSYLKGQKLGKSVKLTDKTLSPEEKLLFLHDIKELERHISVIEML